MTPQAESVGKTLRVLLVEDSDADAELLLAELKRTGYDVICERVQTAEEMRAALRRQSFDVVLSDYSLPAFSGPAAFAVLQEHHPDLPFIIVSGTIGEETAVAALRAGASDFLVKGKLARLASALERELRERELKRERALERDALEAQLRQSQKLEGIGRLAGGIAHDFNNLLTAIIGYTEMVLEQIGPDKPISHDLEEIRKASDRAAALTRQLLAFSRKQMLHVAAMDLNEIVLSMRDMLQRLIGEDIDLRVELAAGSQWILADRVQLEQVLMNLVINARDAMPRGGTLTIETTPALASEAAAVVHEAVAPGGYVRLRVTDTGTGMDADTQARIFEPFFTTKPTGQGTGLGLSMVYGVVQQLGGHIGVASEMQRGTTFTMYFPASDAHDQTASVATAKVRAPLAEGRELVLVVEDQSAVRQLVSRVLTRHGYKVLEAGGVAEALRLVETISGTIQLVVSDMVMPIMDGPEMVALLRETRPDLKVLYMSGYSGETIARRGGLAASTTVLEKPFTASVLLHAVREALQ